MDREQIIIVDENDNPIGFKDRDELDYGKDIYRVSALWLTNSKGYILLAQRSTKKTRGPGLWGPAAEGTVDINESYEDCIIREAREELGLINLKFESGQKIFRDGTRKYFRQLFRANIDKDVAEFQLQEEEVDRAKWISPQELVQDVRANPDKYVSSMPQILETFNLINK